MPTDDTGVTELLRRASDGLTPDVDRLVSGGITRGRSRQRRARIGTAAGPYTHLTLPTVHTV